MLRKGLVGLTLLAMGIVSVQMLAQEASAAPEPDVVSRSWQFNFEYGDLSIIGVPRTQSPGYDWYWYLPYIVTNNTGQDRLFLPEVTIATDTGDIIEASENIPPRVFEQIKQATGIRFLESPVQVVGTLRQGSDNAKESVIVWPAFEHDIDEVKIFIAGLSGETVRVSHPVTEEDIFLRRTLMLVYDLSGTPTTPQRQASAVVFNRAVEVMR